MKKLHLLFGLLLLASWQPARGQTTNSTTVFGDHRFEIENERGQCPRFVLKRFDFISRGFYEFQLSFNQGLTWEPMLQHGGRVLMPGDPLTGGHGSIDMTDVFERYPSFRLRLVFGVIVDPLYEQYKLGAPDQYIRGAVVINEATREQLLAQYRPTTYRLGAHRFVADSTFQVIEPRLVVEAGQPEPAILHWEAALVPTDPDQPWVWSRIHNEQLAVQLSNFIFADEDRVLAVRPVLRNCFLTPNIYPDTAYIELPAKTGGGIATASTDAVCGTDPVNYTVSGHAHTPFGWAFTLKLDSLAPNEVVPVNPDQLFNVTDELLMQLAPVTSLTLAFKFAPHVQGELFRADFERRTGRPMQYSAFALTAVGRNWVASRPAKVLILPSTVGGDVHGPVVVCRGNGLPDPLQVRGYRGRIIRWESSTDSLNWVAIAHREASYEPPALQATTWFRTTVSGECTYDFASSNAVRIDVVDAPQAGAVGLAYGQAVVCGSNPAPLLQVRGSTGNVVGWRHRADAESEPVFVRQRLPVYSPPLVQAIEVQAVVEAYGCLAVSTPWFAVERKEPQLPSQVDLVIDAIEQRCINHRLQHFVRLSTIVQASQSRFRGLEFIDLLKESSLLWNEIPPSAWQPVPISQIQYAGASARILDWIGPVELALPDSFGRYRIAMRAVYADPDLPECGLAYSPPLFFENSDPLVCPTSGSGLGVCEIRLLDSVLVCAGRQVHFGIVTKPASGELYLEASRTRNFSQLIGSPIPCQMGCPSEPLRDTTYFRVRVVFPDGSPDIFSNIIRVDVRPSLRVGRLRTDVEQFCAGELSSPIQLSNHRGRIIRWERSENGTDWQTMPGTASVDRLFPQLNQTTWFRVRLFQCDSGGFTEPLRITVLNDPPTEHGLLEARENWVCPDSGTEVRLVGASGRVLYWLRTTNNRIDTLFTDAVVLETGALTSAAQYRAFVRNGRCSIMWTPPVTVQVRDLSPPSDWPSQTIPVCWGNDYTVFSNETQGISHAPWELSTDRGTTWQSAPGSNPWSNIYSVLSVNQTTLVRRILPDACGTAVPLQPVRLEPYDPQPGSLSGPGSVCHASGSHAIRLTGHSDRHIQSFGWQLQNSQGVWTDININRGQTQYLFPSTEIGSFMVRVRHEFANCTPQFTEPLTIQVESQTVPAQISGPARTCVQEAGQLVADLKGASLIRWEQSATPCGQRPWQALNAASATLPLQGVPPGRYCFRVVSNRAAVCREATSPPVEVEVTSGLTPPRVETAQNRYCANQTPHPLRAITSDTPQSLHWQTSSDQRTWTDLPGATSPQVVPPAAPGTAWYRAVAWSPGCGEAISQPVQIDFPSQALALAVAETTPAECATCPTGTVRVAAAGGLVPYRYRLGAGAWQADPAFRDLSPGTYTLTARDAAGCTATLSVKLEEKVFVCLPPTDLRIVETEPTALRVAWTPVEGARSYVIEVKPNTPAIRQWLAFPVPDARAGSHRLTGLQAGTTYLLRIRSRCPRGAVSDNADGQPFQTPLARKAAAQVADGGLIEVYPNPTRGPLTVKGWEVGTPWRLYDVTGRLVDSGLAAGPAADLNLSQLPAGVYVLEVAQPAERLRFRILKTD